jgi:hypothetical protein
MATEQLAIDLAPITSSIGFLECDAQAAAKAFELWQGPLHAKRGIRLERRTVKGTFFNRIQNLLPLTSVERRRFLFVSTESRWTAYFDNGWQGTDVFSVVSYLSKIIGCNGVRATHIPNSRRKSPEGEIGRYGATVLELYEPNVRANEFLNIRRSISVANDGGRWRFDANGDPFDFERLERYEARSIRDRFTFDLLCEYLKHLGLDPYSPGFFEVLQPSEFISKSGPSAKGLKDFSLEEVRKNY